MASTPKKLVRPTTRTPREDADPVGCARKFAEVDAGAGTECKHHLVERGAVVVLRQLLIERGRPGLLPLARAAFMPSRVRSAMRRRSN